MAHSRTQMGVAPVEVAVVMVDISVSDLPLER